MSDPEPVLAAMDLQVHYGAGPTLLRAVDGVSLSVGRGETLGLVGESGCGKSTLGRTLTRLQKPTSGQLVFEGRAIGDVPDRRLRATRRHLQYVFQDAAAALNPRHTIRSILTAPLVVHGLGDRTTRLRRVAAVIDRVGLPKQSLDRFPHEFSGGQRQRIGIARALILEPRLVVLDEPVSALDLSVQAQIINLLTSLQREQNLSYVFVSHDLSVVRYIADRIAVMYRGKIVETGESGALWSAPQHAYTKTLLAAIPHPSRSGPDRAT